MLDEESRQGVTTIVATPHFCPTPTSLQRFMIKREKIWNEALPLAQERGIRLIKGADVLARIDDFGDSLLRQY